MKKNKYLNQELDPELAELLAEMREIPPRDPQEAAQRKSRYYFQLEQMMRGSVQIPQKNLFEKIKENFNMATPKLRTVMTTAMIVLLAVVFLFSSAGITAVAASRSLPGDNLYNVKTGLERTRLNVTSQESERVNLNLRYAELRLDEIERLIEKGRFDDLHEAISVYELYVKQAIDGLEVVSANDPQTALQLNSQLTQLLSQFAAAMANYSAALPASAKAPLDGAIEFSKSAGAYKGELEFTGTVEAMESGYWTIGGFTITITEATEIEDDIRVGDEVEVEAWVDMQGNIYAEEIERYDDDMDDDMDNDMDDDMDDDIDDDSDDDMDGDMDDDMDDDSDDDDDDDMDDDMYDDSDDDDDDDMDDDMDDDSDDDDDDDDDD